MIFERKLSDILCETTSIVELQRSVFLQSSERNPAVKCNDVHRARLDFDAIAQQVSIAEGLTPERVLAEDPDDDQLSY
jgi:hypothetical protein